MIRSLAIVIGRELELFDIRIDFRIRLDNSVDQILVMDKKQYSGMRIILSHV
jgi:hypothetical protein